MKMLKITLGLLFALLLLGVFSLVIDYYYYSWTSFIQPFGCDYKSVGVEYGNKKVIQEYDLIQIGNEIKANPNYKFESWNNEGRLFVSRIFGDVKYNVALEKHNSSDGRYTEANFYNSRPDLYEGQISLKNEKPTTPNQYIKSNIHRMIYEMPLTDAQKDELKSKVQISCSPTTKIGL